MKVYIGPYDDNEDSREIDIEIHNYDTWNADHTLALIILPVLRQLRDEKHGSPHVDNEDLPEKMRYPNVVTNETPQYDLFADEDFDSYLWSAYEMRWDWVIDEMIWAFEQLAEVDNWESQYWTESPELDLNKYPEDKGKKYTPVRWAKEGKCDWRAREKHQERMTNGFRLFGKYYQALWD